MLYDDLESGIFYVQGERKQPDHDGVYRPIVIARGYGPPGNQNARQLPAPSTPAAIIAAPTSTTSRAISSAASTTTTLVPATQSLPNNLVDLCSNAEDVKPVIEGTAVRSIHGRDEQHHEGSSSTSDSGSDDESFLLKLRKEAASQQNKYTSASPAIPASKQPVDPSKSATVNQQIDPSKSAIWRYIMTLTRKEIPVPDDAAIIELLTLPKRRNVTKGWESVLRKHKQFQLRTLSGLVLYIGGDEASKSPCEQMGCSTHPQVHVFPSINFNKRFTDYRYPFSKCIFLPNHLHNSPHVIERFGPHLCCNAYCKSWMKPTRWEITVPDEGLKTSQDMAHVEVAKNNLINMAAETELAQQIPSNALNSVTSTNKAGNSAVRPSPSQASLPGCSPLQPVTVARDINTLQVSAQRGISTSSVKKHKDYRSELESSPARPISNVNETTHNVQIKEQKMEKKERRKKKEKKRKTKHQQDEQAGVKEHSSASQAHASPVCSTVDSPSHTTTQDMPTAPSRSFQKAVPENSHRETVFNLASGGTAPIGFKGEESRLLQASKKQSLECKVWSGSVKLSMIGDGTMSVPRKVDVGETWTVGPDSHCLVSNFFPEAQETTVVFVKSKPVVASTE